MHFSTHFIEKSVYAHTIEKNNSKDKFLQNMPRQDLIGWVNGDAVKPLKLMRSRGSQHAIKMKDL